jgi:hypothetical protein
MVLSVLGLSEQEKDAYLHKKIEQHKKIDKDISL